MDPKHKEILRAHRLQLSEQLIVDDTIIQYLYQEDILTQSQVEEIQSETSNKNKTLRLLYILPSRGPNAFNVFLKSLEQDFPWIKEKLMLLLAEGSASLSDPAQWSVPPHLLHLAPSHQQLNKLASCLGSEWEMVLMDLDLSPGEIYRCRADHPLSVQSQVLAGLVMWKQLQGRRATVQRLLQSLQAAEVHPSVLNQVFF
ncbi:death domain-containing protein CRADD [Electrophorus electricus]|uniref:CASP2 and RIPK1 domain containing adaptor with death domain n=1 Tax=Electrophorus electricus TaxID=8005 RepID=A0AAY5EZ51_ELEEL|nr:death domain-containing protein CRADD [Electrophorus electricus]